MVGDMDYSIYKPLDYIPDEYDPGDWQMNKTDIIRKLGSDTWKQIKKGPPESISHRTNMSPVKDQKAEGSCVGFTVAAVVEWFAVQEWLRLLKVSRSDITSSGSNPFSDLSERWIYEYAQDIDRFPGEKGGTSIKAALKVLQTKGVPVEKAWPYKPEHRGSPEDYAEDCAEFITIDNYYRVKTGSIKDHMRALFCSPMPVAVEVYSELYNPDNDGTVKLPGKNSKLQGYHALCLTGYENYGDVFEVKNSWGSGYGDRGYCYLPKEYIRRHEVSAWSFNRISSFNPEDIKKAADLMKS